MYGGVMKMDTISIELPYMLIDAVGNGGERIILKFKSFTQGRSAGNTGVTGDFELFYECSGMHCSLECDLTIGNLSYFEYDLDTAYDINSCRDSTAVLESYEASRTRLVFRFDEKARCYVSGNIRNKGDGYKSGISFDDVEIDTVNISDILCRLKDFFNEVEKIQGNRNFY